MFWAPPVSHGPDLMGLHDDCSSDAHKHGFPFFCWGPVAWKGPLLPTSKVISFVLRTQAFLNFSTRTAYTCSLSDCMFVACFETRSGRRLVCGRGEGRGEDLWLVWWCKSAIRQSASERSGMMLLLITSSTGHVWYCSAWGAVRQATGLGHEKAAITSCTHLTGHISSSTVPGWHYVAVCLVPHSRRNSALQVVAGALQVVAGALQVVAGALQVVAGALQVVAGALQG